MDELNPQRRLIEALSNSNASLDSIAADDLEMVFDEADAVNIHGLRYCFSIEPENADANANGFWILYCFPADIIQTASSALPNTFGDLDDKTFNPYVWGIGCWTASNQAPYHYEFTPRTSRTCQRGGRIVAMVVKNGISAGAVRINQTLTCFTSS